MKVLSNEFQDFVSAGLYPGGTGIIKHIRYVLWDYMGTQPENSHVAVYVKFQPIDGSGEGKEQEIYWGVGAALDKQGNVLMTPDPTGCFILSDVRSGLSNNSNWHQVLEAFVNTCGLPHGKLSQPGVGISALEGSTVTLARVEQKKRNIQDDTPEDPEKKKRGNYKSEILIPVRAKFPWEEGSNASRRPAPRSTATATAATTTTTPAAASATATATPSDSVNGTLTDVLTGILADNGGTVEVSSLAKLITTAMSGHDRAVRMECLKSFKSALPGIAESQGWSLDDTTLSM
jgi:hypothetical protein